MMSIQELYSAIVDQEKVAFYVKEEKLSLASKAIGTCYNQQSLKEGSTYIDYNETANRCAYLYRFGVLHTNMVIKYFQQLLESETVKDTLESRKSLNVCCVGGGPGTDIVGIFKVLAGNRSFYGKVENVTVLDICGGWRNSFKRIVAHLTGGKVDGVPPDFVDGGKFSAKLVQADLLQTPLPPRVVQTLSEADIVCMVKFASAVIGKPESLNAFKVIGESFKLGSIVLFIDNSNEGKIFMQRLPEKNYCSLQIALGPLHESYKLKQKVPGQTIQHYKKQPLKTTNISVIGWVKATSTNQDSCSSRDEDSEEISRISNTEKYLCDSTILACYESVSNGNALQKLMKHESTQTEICFRLDMCETDMLIDLCQLLNRTEILLSTLNKLNSANAMSGSHDQNVEEISGMSNPKKYLCYSTIPTWYDSVSNGATLQKLTKHESTQTEMCFGLDMCETELLTDLCQLLNRTEILLSTLNELNSANAELQECCCKKNH